MSDLVGNPEDRFSRVAAHMYVGMYFLKNLKLALDCSSVLVSRSKPFSKEGTSEPEQTCDNKINSSSLSKSPANNKSSIFTFIYQHMYKQ